MWEDDKDWKYYDSGSTNLYDEDWITCGSTSYATSSNASTYWVPVPRRVLIESPEHWGEEDILAFVRLINEHTTTCGVIEFVIYGKVLITDPAIDVRSMEDAIPLIKRYASKRDRTLVDEFFKVHTPVEGKS